MQSQFLAPKSKCQELFKEPPHDKYTYENFSAFSPLSKRKMAQGQRPQATEKGKLMKLSLIMWGLF